MSGKNAVRSDCGYKNGMLPACAPLAVSYIPRQQESIPQYDPAKALTRGTLFPGLDLPLGNITNGAAAESPITELMAIDLAAHDLALYLDTHSDDKEAFEAYKDLLKMAKEGRMKYTREYGPLMQTDMMNDERYSWLDNPWPWDSHSYKEER